MTDALDLLPCPFCGERLNVSRSRLASHSTGSLCVMAKVAVVVDDPAQLKAWNTRAALSAMGGTE